MLKRKYQKMYEGFGLHKKGDPNHEINVPKKIRRVAGIIFILILICKIVLLVLTFTLPDYPVKHALNSLHLPYKHQYNKNQLIGVGISFLFIIPSYAMAAYATLNTKYKMTDFFFEYTNRRLKRLLVIIAISYALTFYFSYTGYSSFVNEIHKPLTIVYFVPAIIHLASSLTLLGIYFLISKYLEKNSDYKKKIVPNL